MIDKEASMARLSGGNGGQNGAAMEVDEEL